MKTYILLTLITALITLQTKPMDDHMILLHAKNYVMRTTESPFASQNKKPYENQIFPDDIWYRIIGQISSQDRANVKETCKQLSTLTSVDHLNQFIMYNFNIGDDKDRSRLFSAVIKTSNPELITAIMQYAHKETLLLHAHRKYICININMQEAIQKEHTQRYATHLMKKALKQKNKIMINRLEKEDYDHNIINSAKGGIEHKKKFKTNDSRSKCVIGWSVTGLCAIMCFVIYATSHAVKYGNYTYSPITMPSFH